jgi:hypothetical protein
MDENHDDDGKVFGVRQPSDGSGDSPDFSGSCFSRHIRVVAQTTMKLPNKEAAISQRGSEGRLPVESVASFTEQAPSSVGRYSRHTASWRLPAASCQPIYSPTPMRCRSPLAFNQSPCREFSRLTSQYMILTTQMKEEQGSSQEKLGCTASLRLLVPCGVSSL